MRSINKVILIGNLTRDPEMRQTPNGQNVVTFGIATNREWVTKDGRKQSSAEYHDLVAWAKLADICHQYLKKGKLIYVEGYLKTRSWDTPEGIKKFRTEVVVQDMIMLDKRGEGGNDYYPEESTAQGTSYEETPQSEEKKTEESQEEEKTPVKAETEEPKEEEEQQAAAEKAPDAPKEQEKKEAEEPAEEKENKLDIDSDLGL